MHCDDKRTIFVLKKSLEEYSIEKQNQISNLEQEKNPVRKLELQSKIDNLEKTISEIMHQLSTME